MQNPIATLGIDLAKDKMHVVGLDEHGKVRLRRQFSRSALMRFLGKHPVCRVAMEACAGSHHIARKAEAFAHDAHLLPAQYVRAYVKSQKNDYADAEAIAEAATRPTMREVSIKSVSQQELQLLHRERDAWVGQRTDTANRIRAVLLEFGITVAKGLNQLRQAVPFILEDADNGLPERVRDLVAELWADLYRLDERVDTLTGELEQRARQDERTRRLLDVPGVGPIVATALVAAIGDGAALRCGRDLAAWLGLVPRQHSSGGKPRLLGISKRGNRYLRTLIIHGARAVLRHAGRRRDALGAWLRRLLERKHPNVAAVALANKLTRVSWAVLRRGDAFDVEAMVA
ncbi:MAG TPA: IS110 family transposase [Gammaproteobacteria bacterium]|nr:IS110 family transposase [Gammaproteobacteria bacterium]